MVFMDLGPYEKVQPNILDHQKILEMVLYNNALTALSDILSGFKANNYTLSNAPFGNTKLTQALKYLVGKKTSSLSFGLLCCI